ncbi:hypothetical protein LTR36_010792 [Oleoguttula mirabilis]|uniref:Cytochrome P450 n=1 Tax=Oleoguttula mirabilis TaxID=1507867 RepID=A0AAV9JR29_9PEZI|nr:hypothetical protein LTR36_010792 [Oleoguttula mirabilis]
MLTSGAGTKQCPGSDFHIAITAKFLVSMLPQIDLTIAEENICFVPNDMTFDEMKNRFIAKVSLPKAGALMSPTLPLRATAPAFAPDTTTAPMYPPGLGPDKPSYNPFSIASAGIEGVGRYLAALKGGKEFVPIDHTHGADHAAADAEATAISLGSPTFSNATTVGPESGISEEDKQLLCRLIGDHKTAMLLEVYPPATEELVPAKAVSSWPIQKPAQRAKAHEAIDRIWRGRLKHATDKFTLRIMISLAGPPKAHLRYDKEVGLVAPRSLQQRPAAIPVRTELHGAWNGFATVEHTRHADKDAQDLKDARDAEKYAKDRKEREEQYEAQRVQRASMPQATFKQTFKQISRDETTEGKLGGPRKFVEVVKTEHTGDGTVVVVEETIQPETSTKPETASKPKRNTLPPHLRLRSVSPPLQSTPGCETNSIQTVLAAQSEGQMNARPRSSSPPRLRTKSQDANVTDKENHAPKHEKTEDVTLVDAVISNGLSTTQTKSQTNAEPVISPRHLQSQESETRQINTTAETVTQIEVPERPAVNVTSNNDREQAAKQPIDTHNADDSETEHGGVAITSNKEWVAASLPLQFA